MSKPRVIVVPTIDEVVGRGRSPQFALAFVAGERAKFDYLAENPETTDFELLLVGEDALERKLMEIFGAQQVDALIRDALKNSEQFKEMAANLEERLKKQRLGKFVELKSGVGETDPLKLLGLIRRGMNLTLALSGHVADSGVTQWLREVEELEAALKPAPLPPIEEA